MKFNHRSRILFLVVQAEFLKKQKNAYGGELLKKRKARSYGRALSTKYTMHLVLRSSLAKGKWSFRTPENAKKVRDISLHHCQKNGVRLVSMANVGNHLHFQIHLTNRHLYKAFIRGLTGAIVMAVTGANRWAPLKEKKFWDYRPYTRIAQGLRAFFTLRDYIQINRWEGFGYSREQAKIFVAFARGS